MSIPARQRLGSRLSRLSPDAQQYIDTTAVSDAAGKATTLVKRTGDKGRRALDAMSSSGRRAADGLLRLEADATTQQVMVNAWARGDISSGEMASALRKYNSLGSADRQTLQGIVRTGGPEAAVSAGRTSDEALAAIFDSGTSEIDQALALRRLDDLDNRDAAETLLTETDGDTTDLFTDIEADELDGLLAGSCSVSGSASLSGAPISGGAGGPVDTQRVFSGVDVSSVASCDLDVEFLQKIDDYNDRVDSFDAQDFARKYGDLDGEYEGRFRELAKNDQYGDSWLKSVSAQETNSESVRRTLQRIDNELDGDSALEIEEFVTAREMNNQFPDDWNDPFASGSVVARFQTTGDEAFVRVHRGGNQNGRFLMRQSDIEGLSPAEIESKFSLSYTPEYVSDVTVPEGVRVNMGTVKANFDGDEGAKQFNLGRELEDDQFTDKRPIEE